MPIATPVLSLASAAVRRPWQAMRQLGARRRLAHGAAAVASGPEDASWGLECALPHLQDGLVVEPLTTAASASPNAG